MQLNRLLYLVFRVFCNFVSIKNNLCYRNIRPGMNSWQDDNGLGKFYGQAERAISMGQLRALLHFHLPPIKVVVFDRSSYQPAGWLGDLISRQASCLDAFSIYLFRTSLPSYATGVTTRSQGVRPSRSSRTRDSSSQVSCAHTR